MLPGETISSGAPVDENVSDFKVMKSGAGYYVGTTYLNKDKHGEWEEPNSRETIYFDTEKEAQDSLDSFKAGKGLIGERLSEERATRCVLLSPAKQGAWQR